MTRIFKSVFTVLALTMFFTSVDGQKIIEVRIGDDGNLSLSPSETIELGNVVARRISWQVKDPRIVSFQIAPKNAGQPYPFTEPYAKTHDQSLDLRVIFLLRICRTTEWDYTISAKDAGRKLYSIDPKIAIKPGNTILLALIGLLVIIFTGRFFTKKRKSARNA